MKKEKIFMIPADFKKESVIKFAKKNKNYAIPVVEFYGSIKTSRLGSGRKFFELPDVEMKEFKEYIKIINENGMHFNYVLNTSCISNKDFTKDGQREIINEVQELIDAGINYFTIALPSLIDLFKTYFPNIKVTLSIICGVDSLSKMECYCNFSNIDNIYIHERIYRQSNLMKSMINIAHKYNKKVGIIVNSFCLSECPFRQYHYNFGAHAVYGSEYIIPEYYGSKCALMKIKDKRNILNAPWVRPEDINFYINMGVDRYKISGREMYSNNADMFKVVDTYNSFKYEGNLTDLFMCFTKCAYSEIFNIKNDIALDNYLKNVLNGTFECNVFGCSNCMKCKNALKSIECKKEGVKKWKKIFEERLLKYNEKKQ